MSRNKVCGFPPHSVRIGKFCGLCDVTIPTVISAFTKTAFERSTGARASALNRLPYWHSVNRAPIDHMHNLELGVMQGSEIQAEDQPQQRIGPHSADVSSFCFSLSHGSR
ncbi:unnamed protein product [Tilletia controversa]|nr:unnamed protein product [Tilletia controversa]